MRANLKTLHFSLFILFFASGLNAVAQQASKENSPYNRFGIGTLGDSREVSVRGEGGAATAYMDPFNINAYNPATYSFLKITTLQFGVEASSRNILMNDTTTKTGTATFSYFNLGIPLKKYAGMNFGFTPISSAYYNQSDTSVMPGLGRTARTFEGSGGLQFAYIGLAGQYKGFSAGVNFGYAFGNMRRNSTLSAPTDTIIPDFRNSQFGTYSSIGGIYWKGGLMYHGTLKKDHYINIGAVVTLYQSLNVKRDEYAFASTYLSSSTGIDSAIDTVTYNADVKGKLVLPAEYSFGAHYGKSQYFDIGADFTYSDWSKFRNFGAQDSVADNTWRLSLGGEVTPNPTARKNYLSLVTYRLGFYYGTDYFNIRNTQLTYWGATAGLSFPFFHERLSTQYAKINTTLDIGRRGTTTNGLAREFYVKFTVGIGLSDIWFKKNRFD